MQADFPKTGYVREPSLVLPNGILPISRSTLWRWVREGKFPAPHKLGPNVSAWKAESVLDFMAKAENSGEQAAA